MTFDEYWKLNSKRLHSENPWREELAREVWGACVQQFTTTLYSRLQEVDIYPRRKENDQTHQTNNSKAQEKEEAIPEGNE